MFQMEDEEQIIPNGIVLPPKYINGIKCGGVCDEHYRFKAGSLIHGTDRWKEQYNGIVSLSDSYYVPPKEIDYIEEEVIFGGWLIAHFGHFMMQSLTRMWFHVEHPDDLRRIVFVEDYHEKWMDEFLDLLDIPQDRIFIIQRPTRFLKVIIPEESIHYADMISDRFQETISYIMNNIEPNNKYDKLYLYKHSINTSSVCGEEYFVDYFKHKGFGVIASEDYSVKEKLAFIKGAKEIVTTVGT